MSQARSGERWDREFSAGKYDFLRKPAEKARLQAIAAMIDRSTAGGERCEVVDIGCGEGLLLDYLKAGAVARYVGVDISAVALSRLPDTGLAAVAVHSSLAAWDGKPRAAARRILVASEVLYYGEKGVAELARIAGGGASEAIISCVAGRGDKPNWTAASERLWRDIAATGWPVIERRHLSDKASGIGWDIARYAV